MPSSPERTLHQPAPHFWSLEDEETLYCIPSAYRSPQKLASQIIGEPRQTHAFQWAAMYACQFKRSLPGKYLYFSPLESSCDQMGILKSRCWSKHLVSTSQLLNFVVRVNLKNHLSAHPHLRILGLRNKGELGGKRGNQ